MQKSREDRASRLISLMVRLANSPPFPAVLRNVSANGVLLATDLRIPKGHLLEIGLPALGWVQGHVRWVGFGRIGGRLEDPIDPDRVVAIKPAQPRAPYASLMRADPDELRAAEPNMRRKFI